MTPAQAVTILIHGDSLSAGYGIGVDEAWPSLLSRKLGQSTKFSQYRVVNASISGETTAGGLSRLPALLDRHQPGVVVLELGANDGLRGLPIESMKRNLIAMVDLARARKARVLMVGMRLPPNYGLYAEEFQRAFGEVARQTGTPLHPFLLDGLKQSAEHFQADGLHPTKAAQGIVLDNLWPSLAPLLR